MGDSGPSWLFVSHEVYIELVLSCQRYPSITPPLPLHRKEISSLDPGYPGRFSTLSNRWMGVVLTPRPPLGSPRSCRLRNAASPSSKSNSPPPQCSARVAPHRAAAAVSSPPTLTRRKPPYVGVVLPPIHPSRSDRLVAAVATAAVLALASPPTHTWQVRPAWVQTTAVVANQVWRRPTSLAAIELGARAGLAVDES